MLLVFVFKSLARYVHFRLCTQRRHTIFMLFICLFFFPFCFQIDQYSENMDIVMKTKTHLYEKSGHVFYNVTSTKVDYTLSGLKLRLDNLFEGVKVLGK